MYSKAHVIYGCEPMETKGQKISKKLTKRPNGGPCAEASFCFVRLFILLRHFMPAARMSGPVTPADGRLSGPADWHRRRFGVWLIRGLLSRSYVMDDSFLQRGTALDR